MRSSNWKVDHITIGKATKFKFHLFETKFDSIDIKFHFCNINGVDQFQPSVRAILYFNYLKLNVNVCKEAFNKKCTNKS